MQKLARITSTMCVAVTLLALCGCSTTRKSFDYLFASDYEQRYGANGSAGVNEQFAQVEVNASDGSEGRPVSYLDEVAPEDDGIDVSDFGLSSINDTVKRAVGLGPDQRLAVQMYRKGLGHFKAAVQLKQQGKEARESYLQAAETFQTAAKRWPDSALQQDALFMSGEAYFFADHYPQANEQYEKLLKNYPNTHHIDKVEAKRFAIAQYWLNLNEADPQHWYTWNFSDEKRPRKSAFSNAVRVLDRIRTDDPTGRFADDATMAAGNAHFKEGNWAVAANFYEDLRRAFPSSEHQFMAHFLELKCRLNSYDGENYSVVPLQKANELLTSIRKQFPNEANKPEHDEPLRRAAAEINYKLAEREWAMAKYFDRRWEYGASRYYYNILASDYADTPFGPKASTRLAELAGEPDKPRQQLGWLVNLFPDPYGKPLVAARPQENEIR